MHGSAVGPKAGKGPGHSHGHGHKGTGPWRRTVLARSGGAASGQAGQVAADAHHHRGLHPDPDRVTHANSGAGARGPWTISSRRVQATGVDASGAVLPPSTFEGEGGSHGHPYNDDDLSDVWATGDGGGGGGGGACVPLGGDPALFAGGVRNSQVLAPLLQAAGIPVLSVWNATAPLWWLHPGSRGPPVVAAAGGGHGTGTGVGVPGVGVAVATDCVSYCTVGAPQVWVYMLAAFLDDVDRVR